MAEIFTKENHINLMKNRVVWFLGDSNIRALYKDFIWLARKGTLIPQSCLKTKLENSYLGDELTAGRSLCRGRNYEEERCFYDNKTGTSVFFMFLTKCLTNRVQKIIKDAGAHAVSPDVVIINSCLWDICRWGPNGVTDYKSNLIELMKLMKLHFSPKTLVIWLTTPPVSSRIKGGFLIEQLQFMQNSCRFEVMEANIFARDIVVSHGFDVIDIHYYLILQIHRRVADGVHWSSEAIRFITNTILTHISLVWKQALPGNFMSSVVQRMINRNTETVSERSAITTVETTGKSTARSCKENIRQQSPRKRGYNRRQNNRPY